MRTIAFVFAAATALAAQEPEKKKVMCTLPVLKAVADELSGGAFEVVSLSQPDQDPHFVSPTPSLMKKLRQAELFVEVGLQLELWADEVANGSGNPRVMRGGRGRLVASAGVPREEVPKVVSRSEGDVHPEGNPHVWLDPLRVRILAENVARGLEGLAPDQVPAIRERLRRFQERIDEAVFGPDLVKEAGGRALARRALEGTLLAYLEEKKLADRLGGWLRKAAPLRGMKVVEFHKTWVYLAKVVGFEIVGSVEPKPGIKPGPRHLEELRGTIRSQGVRLILVENYQDLGNPRDLAGKTGAKVVVVPSQPGGEPGTGDYFKFMDHVLDRLVAAAKE